MDVDASDQFFQLSIVSRLKRNTDYFTEYFYWIQCYLRRSGMSRFGRSIYRRSETRVPATSDGLLSAGAVVVAAGTASVGLLAPLGYQLPLGRVVGITGVVSAPAGTVSRVLYPGAYHVRPTTDGRVAIGSRDMDDLVDEDTDASSPPSWMNQLLDMARSDCPALDGSRIEELRVGARPMPVDGLPIVGPVPGVQGAYVAAMHSGVSLAAIIGQTVAGEIPVKFVFVDRG